MTAAVHRSSGPDEVAWAIDEIAAGRAAVVLDDGAAPHGRLVLAADAATPANIAFLIRHTTGLICVALPARDLDRLDVPPLAIGGGDRAADAFAVSVDARDGITTGISATDRAHTLRLLADPDTGPDDLARPGHVVPVRVGDGGVLARPGVAEAAVDLARAAGRRPASVLADLVADDGPLLTPAGCRDLADGHGLPLITVAQLAAHRRRHDPLVERAELGRVPTPHGELPVLRYTDRMHRDRTAVALVPDGIPSTDLLVALHGECPSGDLFGVDSCECGAQLQESLRVIARSSRAALVHVRGGQPHHPFDDAGLDLVAHVLRDLEVRRVRLLDASPTLLAGLRRRGLDAVTQIPARCELATA